MCEGVNERSGLSICMDQRKGKPLAQGNRSGKAKRQAPLLPCMPPNPAYFSGITTPRGTGTAVTLFCGEPSIRRSV